MKNNNKKKKKKKNVVVNFFATLILIGSILGLGYCGYNLYIVYSDYHQSDTEYDNLAQSFTKKPDTEPKKKDDIKLSNTNKEGYPFIQIDWNELKKVNPDVVGWIRIPGTVVDYPIVKGKTNDTYIHTTFEGKSPSSAGAIFLDYRNSGRLDDYVSVIYGHNMKNGSMFSGLKKYLKEDYRNENKYIEIYTPQWSKVYTPVFIYTGHYSDPAYDFTIRNKESYVKWLMDREKQSKFKSPETGTDKNSIILSSCYGNNGTEYRCIFIIQPTNDFDPVYN